MLCSHTKKFIYIKTKKTASTSVEVLLEPFCLDSPRPAQEHGDMVVNTSGIIGYRGKNWKGKPFYNHMPAADILAQLGSEVFWSYKKICIVRNPFDKAVSMFWFLLPHQARQALLSAPFDAVRSAFRQFIRSEHTKFDQSASNNCCDWYIYTIDDRVVIDVVLRYETLASDLEVFFSGLGVQFDTGGLSFYKSGFRVRREHFSEYYDAEALAIAQNLFRKEINHFNYAFQDIRT
jgi:hypothetical protein